MFLFVILGHSMYAMPIKFTVEKSHDNFAKQQSFLCLFITWKFDIFLNAVLSLSEDIYCRHHQWL